jgi:hypothetical protein
MSRERRSGPLADWLARVRGSAGRPSVVSGGDEMADPEKKEQAQEIVIRIDLLVEAQQKVVKHVGKFLGDAADMTMKGQFSPTAWLLRYATMWQELAKDLGGESNPKP